MDQPDPLSPFSFSIGQDFTGSSPKRRRAEEKDEGIGSPDALEEEKLEDLRREMIELRQQLDKERSVRMILEEQVCVNLCTCVHMHFNAHTCLFAFFLIHFFEFFLTVANVS